MKQKTKHTIQDTLMIVAPVLLLMTIGFIDAGAGRPPAKVDTVCVQDGDGTVLSIVHPFEWYPASIEELKAGTASAVNLAGRSTGRNDVIQASGDVRVQSSIWRPGFRKNPHPPGAGICGCGGGCGTCELCKVVCDKDQCHTVCSCAEPIYCQETGR